MHPCCGGSLQKGTKIIAIVKMVLCLITFGIGIRGISLAANTTSAAHRINDNAVAAHGKSLQKNVEADGASLMVHSILLTGMSAMGVFYAMLLFLGAQKRNRTLCVVWFVISCIGLFGGVFQLLAGLSRDPVHKIALRFGGIFSLSYFLWVVWAFMSELKEGPVVMSELEEGCAVPPHANSKA